MKKRLTILSIIFALSAILVVVILLSPLKDTIFIVPEVETVTTDCDPYSDIDFTMAAENLSNCDCLTDSLKEEQCKNSIKSAVSYADAISNSSVSSCDNVSPQNIKEACIKIVKDKIAFNEKEKAKLKATLSNQ